MDGDWRIHSSTIYSAFHVCFQTIQLTNVPYFLLPVWPLVIQSNFSKFKQVRLCMKLKQWIISNTNIKIYVGQSSNFY